MARFNLLDEPWIRVMVTKTGETEEVSLLELFQHAPEYADLAGEMKTQDFAVLRTLLAVLHTVFSRFDAQGRPYEWVQLDESYRQVEDVDEDDVEDYAVDLMQTWQELWQAGTFPPIVMEYLEKWRDRFYLLDDKHPFYQVLQEDIAPDRLKSGQAGKFWGKNINRTISESGNKEALFSSVGNIGKKDNKNILSAPEIVRWVIMFHGYTGAGEKIKFRLCPSGVKASNGWLYDLGGLYAGGRNLFETLLLNLVLVPEVDAYIGAVQRPAWESDSAALLTSYFALRPLDNMAEIYTRWSRAIYINPEHELTSPFYCELVKLPEVNHSNQFLEPMTLWKFDEKGENKNTFLPRKHRLHQSLWRSFGLIGSFDAEATGRAPGIYQWLNQIGDVIGNYQLRFIAVGMESDGNPMSRLLVNEIVDAFSVHDSILFDTGDAGWARRIEDAVEVTKQVVEKTYGMFVKDVLDLRNIADTGKRRTEYLEQLYFSIDAPFKEWLATLQPHDDKEVRIAEWYAVLKQIVRRQADDIVRESGMQEYKGRVVNERFQNIMTAYNSFRYFLDLKLPTKEEETHAEWRSE